LNFAIQKLLGYEAKDVENVFKEESNKKRSDIYEVYQTYVQKYLIFGREKSQLPPEFTKARLAHQEQKNKQSE